MKTCKLRKIYKSRYPNGHWFDESSMVWFDSEAPIGDHITDLVGNIYFISSEQGPGLPRRYTIQYMGLTNGIHSLVEFNKLTKGKAQKVFDAIAEKISENKRVPIEEAENIYNSIIK